MRDPAPGARDAITGDDVHGCADSPIPPSYCSCRCRQLSRVYPASGQAGRRRLSVAERTRKVSGLRFPIPCF